MKLTKKLILAGKPLDIVSDLINLRLNTVGEAIFEVREEPANSRNALVEFYAGVDGEVEYLMFTGAVTEVRRLAPGRVRMVVRELCAVLELPIIINRQHSTARDVLAKIEQETGLRFLLPAGAAYLDERRVRYQHYGPGIGALDLLAKLWKVEGVVWFQLPDGRMYWGNWIHGPYTKAELPIEPKLALARDDKARTVTLPYIPALRPGMMVRMDFRFRIEAVNFSGDAVKLEWRRF